MTSRWHCSECGCNWATALRRAKRRGWTPHPWSKTCGGSCSKARTVRLARERRVAGKKAKVAKPDHGSGWHCSECGADLELANTKRRRLGMSRMFSTRQVVCTPACGKTRTLRIYAARFGSAPRSVKGQPRGPH